MRVPRARFAPVLAVVPLLLAAACGGGRQEKTTASGTNAPGDTGAATQPASHSEPAVEMPVGRVAVCDLRPVGASGVTGRVTFTSVPGGVRIEAEISGLTPGAHGFHIHEYGDCSSPDGKSAGGHFNPHGVDHGGPDDQTAHVGDMGNVRAAADGSARLSMISRRMTIGAGDSDILGRGIIVHAQPDDLKSQPTGAAGPRVACGVILEQGKNTPPVVSSSSPY